LELNVFEKNIASLFRAEFVLKITSMPSILVLDYGCPKIARYATE